MTEFELFQALRPLYLAREYALLPQTANGTGMRANRHADALALNLWPSRGLHLSGFEMKSYRGDWLRELKDPEKAEEIAKYCNYWWIVAANASIVKPDELPQPWGLMVWDEKKAALVKIKAAPFREATPPDLPFIAAMLRKAQEVVTPEAVIEEVRRKAREEGRKEGEERARFDLEDFRKLKERVRAFEKVSGVKIDGWEDAHDIGEAVNAVLHGTVAREQARLRSIAERILKEIGPQEE
jgi:hypothetical protein